MIAAAAAVAAAAIFSTTCAMAQGYGAGDAPASQARTALPVKSGKVLDVQEVHIDIPAGPNSGLLGGAIGAAAGALLGKDGGWQGQALAGTLGAAAGAKAGQMLSAEKRPAQQVIVQPDNGEPVAIIQEAGAAPLAVGQRVYLVGNGQALRAVPASSN